MNLEELKEALRKSGIKDFNIVVNPVGPDNEWTEAEQEDDCCQLVPDHDPCIGDGRKAEPWNGWTDQEKQELGFFPKGPTAQELLNDAERVYGKGNVHLNLRKVGPSPCGEKITNFVGEKECCFKPSELLKSVGPTSVELDSNHTFRVTSGTGELPVTWGAIGTGVSVTKTSETEAEAHFDSCLCEPVVVYAQDTCESAAPWIVTRTGGSWSNADDQSFGSYFGWFQDGDATNFYVIGMSDDHTKVSTQYYTQAQYVGTKEQVCGTTMPGINHNPLVQPKDTQGYEKCEGLNIWVQEEQGFENVWNVRYPIDSQGTNEWTHTCVDNPSLEYDEENSLEVIGDNDAGAAIWANGEPPFVVTVYGQDIFIDSARTKTQGETSNRSILVYSGPDSCGGGSVSVIDACGKRTSGSFRSVNGVWRLKYSTSAYGCGSIHGDWETDGTVRTAPYEAGCPFVETRPDGALSMDVTHGDDRVSSTIDYCGIQNVWYWTTPEGEAIAWSGVTDYCNTLQSDEQITETNCNECSYMGQANPGIADPNSMCMAHEGDWSGGCYDYCYTHWVDGPDYEDVCPLHDGGPSATGIYAQVHEHTHQYKSSVWFYGMVQVPGTIQISKWEC